MLNLDVITKDPDIGKKLLIGNCVLNGAPEEAIESDVTTVVVTARRFDLAYFPGVYPFDLIDRPGDSEATSSWN